MLNLINIPAFTDTMFCWLGLAACVAGGLSLILFGMRQQLMIAHGAGVLLIAGGFFWVNAPAFAQDALGAAVRELVDQVEPRARTSDAALSEWVREVEQRGDRYQEEAAALAETNHRNIQRGMTLLKSDPFFGQAAEMSLQPQEEDGAIYVAVSLTMPKESLRALALDAQKAGVRVVVRGLVNGSFEQTLVAAKEVFGQDAVGGVAIEPQVFRAFGVDRVPTFIAATAPVEPCQDGVDCNSVATPHDRLAGNISLAEALRLIAQGGDQAPDVAAAALARLEG